MIDRNSLLPCLAFLLVRIVPFGTTASSNGYLPLREAVDDLYLRGPNTDPTKLCALKLKGIST